jgi:hypothetical protein
VTERGFYYDLLDEVDNNANIHRPIVAKTEKLTGRNLICYVASPSHPAAGFSEADVETIEGLLRGLDLTKFQNRLDLLLESPGGTPDITERIVKVCRTYSQGFRVIVAGKAMSAATLVSLGSDEIVLGDTSSLGPIDPQMVYQTKEGPVARPAKSVIDAFTQAIGAAQQAIAAGQPADPFLHMLDRLDVSFVMECIRARQSTQRVAEELLATGLMKGKTSADVSKVVSELMKFGDESYHGRPLWYQDVQKLGLPVTLLGVKDPLWDLVWQLLVRMRMTVVRKQLAKYFVNRDGGVEQRVQIAVLRG